MTKEFRQYVLKHVPTKDLLAVFKRQMHWIYRGWDVMDKIGEVDCGDWGFDPSCKIIMGKFAHWNPYKGHRGECRFSLAEVKAELATREHVVRKHIRN